MGSDAQLGVIHDAMESQRYASDRLRTAERFERLFRTDLVGMALINRKTGCLDECNAKLAEFFGRVPEDFIGRHVAQFESFFPDREQYQRTLVAWTSGAPIRALPIHSALPDGSTRQGLLTIQSLPDSAGDATVDAVLVVDVTAQFQLEIERRQAQRLEAIGQLAGGIAHDFNNLLAVITGYAELLEGGVTRPDDRESLDEIKHAAGRAGKLVQGLLAFSRQAPFDVRTIDLHDSLRTSVRALQEVIGPQIQIQLRLSATRSHVQTDALQLEHALLQLATNARDAMPNGGVLVIETADAGASVRLTVTDTGVGIEPATLERVFEPFFTTKELGGGMGLGLSTVYGIVTQSGGAVTAVSEPPRGTSIEIALPVVDAAGSRAGRGLEREAISVTGTETILLIEEESALAMLIESFFTRLGYRIIHVCRGGDAVRAARTHGSRIDLAIADLRAATLSVSSEIEEIRLMRPDLPIVVIAADSTQKAADLSALGAAVLARPFAMADLAAQARVLLNGVTA